MKAMSDIGGALYGIAVGVSFPAVNRTTELNRALY